MASTPRYSQATLLTSAKLPAFVYHYTSTEGLLGILGSGQLRATDLRYLNDTSELHFGLAEMLRAYEVMAQAPSEGQSLADQLALLYGVDDWKPIGPLRLSESYNFPREHFDPVVNAIVQSLKDSILIGVACFCGEGDLLSQWRGYGIGGFALGFNAHALREIVRNRYLPLTAVVYGKPTVRPILRTVLSQANEILADKSKQQPNPIQSSITLPLLGLAAQVKHPTFESEKEFRLGDVASADSRYADFAQVCSVSSPTWILTFVSPVLT